jgi:outer membrane protein assembly factor BamA
MALRRKYLLLFFLTGIFFSMHFSSLAQTDTVPGKTIKTGQTLFGKVINNFKKDTTEVDITNILKRNDEAYKKYEGLIIRDIIIKRVPFGIPFSDTSKKLVNTLTKVANDLHHLTKTQVISNNLFFKRNDIIQPYLMADNERFLRQLPYLLDAGFIVVPISPGSDSADVIVMVKDVFSLGGAIGSLGLQQSQVEIREDNFAGSGNAAVLFGLYDAKRKDNFAFGGEYLRRNIGGSFIDGNI